MERLKKLATKAELKPEQYKIVKLQSFDLRYFLCKSHFEHNSTQNILVFQPVQRHFEKIGNSKLISI